MLPFLLFKFLVGLGKGELGLSEGELSLSESQDRLALSFSN